MASTDPPAELRPFRWPGLEIDVVTRVVSPSSNRITPGDFTPKVLEPDELNGLAHVARSRGRTTPGELWAVVRPDADTEPTYPEMRKWIYRVNKKITTAGALCQIGRHDRVVRQEPLDGFVRTLYFVGAEFDADARLIRTSAGTGRVSVHTPTFFSVIREHSGQIVPLAALAKAAGLELESDAFDKAYQRFTRDRERWLPEWVVRKYRGRRITLENVPLTRFGDVEIIGQSLRLIDMDDPDQKEPLDVKRVDPRQAKLLALVLDPAHNVVLTEVQRTYKAVALTPENLNELVYTTRGVLRAIGSRCTIQRLHTSLRPVLNSTIDREGLSGNPVTCAITTAKGETELPLDQYRLVAAIANAERGATADDVIDEVWGADVLELSDNRRILRDMIPAVNETLRVAGSPWLVGGVDRGLALVPADTPVLDWQSAIRAQPWMQKTEADTGMILFKIDRAVIAGAQISELAERRLLGLLLASRSGFVPERTIREKMGTAAPYVLRRWEEGGLVHLTVLSREGASGREVGLLVAADTPLVLPSRLRNPVAIADRTTVFQGDLSVIKIRLSAVVRDVTRSDRERGLAARLAGFTAIAAEWLSGHPSSATRHRAASPAWSNTLLLLGHRPLYVAGAQRDRRLALADYTADVAQGIKAAETYLQKIVAELELARTNNAWRKDSELTDAEQRVLKIVTGIHKYHGNARAVEIGAWWSRGADVLHDRRQRRLVPRSQENAEVFGQLGSAVMTSLLREHDAQSGLITEAVVARVLSAAQRELHVVEAE